MTLWRSISSLRGVRRQGRTGTGSFTRFLPPVRSLNLAVLLGVSLIVPDLAMCRSMISARISTVIGVAPLAVFFDASGTTDAHSDGDPFRDLDYEWSFGDRYAGTWGLSGGSRNRAVGPVAAHIYERPGVYAPGLCVRDGASLPARKSFVIQVLDPDRVFAGDKTVCISAKGDFEGCPQGAAQLVIEDLSRLQDYIRPGTRLLFHRGEVWTAPVPVRINVPGPGIIGAYGAGISPDSRGICRNNPEIRTTACGVPLLVVSDRDPRFSDWRIMDLSLIGACAGDPPNGVQAAGAAHRALLYRLRIRAFRNGILFPRSILDHWNRNGGPPHSLHSGLTIADCVVSEAFGGKGGCLLYLNAAELAVMGNELTDASGAEHVLRIPFADRAVIAHNLLKGPGPGKHVLKLHGPLWSGRGLGFEQTTRRVVVSGNLFETREKNDWNVVIGPSSSRYDERIQDVIFEGNVVRTGRDTENQVGVKVSADGVTVRNNIFDATGASPHYTAVSISPRGIEPPPVNCVVQNNSVFRGDGGTRVTLVEVGGKARGSRIVNNLICAPRVRDIRILSGEGAHAQRTHNLVSASDAFAVNAPRARDDFKLRVTSPAVDAGAPAAVFRDIRQGLRPMDGNGDGIPAWDVGAHEFSLTDGERP